MRDERRRAPRQRNLKSAQIVFNDRASVIDCLLRNVSESGASLQVSNTIGVPDTFELAFDSRRRTCKVEWRDLNRLGVVFS